MTRVARDVPMNVLVQVFFTRGLTPGLRTLTRRIRAGQGLARIEILPTGGRFELPGVGHLRASYDNLEDDARIEVLTLTIAPDPDARGESEADWLDAQSRLLQSIIADLGAEETHWHLLPGRIDRACEQRLARRAIALLRRPVPAVLPGGPFSAVRLPGPGDSARDPRRPVPARAAPVAANDLPALPRLRNDRVRLVLEALSCLGMPRGSDRLMIRLGTGQVLRMGRATPI